MNIPSLHFQPPLPPANGGEPAARRLDRWLSRAETPSDLKSDGISAVLGDTNIGGLSACCHLIKLLEPAELIKVKDILVAAMRERGLDAELVEAPKLAAPEIPKNANAATKKLVEVMTHITELANEAATREQAAVKAIKQAEDEAKALQQAQAKAESQALAIKGAGMSAAGGGEGGEGNGKLNRWLKRAEQNAAETAPAEEGNGKLGRWLKRAEKKDAATNGVAAVAKAPEPEVDESSTDPLDVALRCCKRVRNAWASADKAGGGAAFLKEKAQLTEEKRALENLMQMVYAVRNTPEQIDEKGVSMPGPGMHPGMPPMPPGMGQTFGMPPPGMMNGMPPGGMGGMSGMMPPGGPPGMMPPGGPPGNGQGMMGQQPMGGTGCPDMSGARQDRVKKNDPNELLAQFLKDRREERKTEVAQMVQEKKNPKKEPAGKGWRAGSPMSSAAKPKEAVRISLSRPPPQFHAQVVMMGPPPEGVQEPDGASREDVMNKEGGAGFFFYPPGHPNHVSGQAALAEGQLRSTVHPQERIAPHWSQASFKAAGMPEVICESRHATFGPLVETSSRLVRCQPPEANTPIKNVDQVKGNIVYIKRGGCSFTKKARMAQAAGAVAMVVANTDRETFGMYMCVCV